MIQTNTYLHPNYRSARQKLCCITIFVPLTCSTQYVYSCILKHTYVSTDIHTQALSHPWLRGTKQSRGMPNRRWLADQWQ